MANDKLFEFCFDVSIILTEETLVLGIIHPETEVCHGTVDIRTVMPLETKVNRKRALSTRSSVFKKKVQKQMYVMERWISEQLCHWKPR